MAIAEMGKLNLVAMSYDQDAILNALQRTGAAEVKFHTETEQTVALPEGGEALRAYLSGAEAALAVLCAAAETYNKEHKIKTDALKDGFEITYSEFMSAGEGKEEADALIAQINACTDEKNALKNELARLERALGTAKAYAPLKQPFSAFADTAHTHIRLGTVPLAAWEGLKPLLDAQELVSYGALPMEDIVLLSVAAHKSVAEETDGALQHANFAVCPYSGDTSGENHYASLLAERERALNALRENAESLYALSPQIKKLKIYCDHLGFALEKEELSEKLRATAKTFLLEAYVPKGAEEAVREAVCAVSEALYLEFSDVPDDEMPPTLMRNGEVVRNFEAITNMYSAPNARELDPNPIMAFFYSFFLGFIMGDIGYGLIMLLGGGFVYFKHRARDSGLKRIAGVFAIGGIFAVAWGILFNSLFGIAVLPFTVMPNAQTDMWSFMGISIPAVLIVALLIGIFQLLVGYLCRAAQCFLRGNIADGLLDGAVWALFSLGVGLAIVGLVDEFGLFFLAKVGGILAAASLLIAMLTAGRKEKLFGKFTKGFGALYSVINYMSDILSYARLYGLMLSGAVIAQIVSQYALTGTGSSVGFIMSGNVGLVILGILLMIVGHVFNLAIGLLGAYIHDARLQYVEFYGRFYEGEGELFTPLGSKHKYVWIVPGSGGTAAGKA